MCSSDLPGCVLVGAIVQGAAAATAIRSILRDHHWTACGRSGKVHFGQRRDAAVEARSAIHLETFRAFSDFDDGHSHRQHFFQHLATDSALVIHDALSGRMQEGRGDIFMVYAEQTLFRYGGIPAAAFVHPEEKHPIIVITRAAIEASGLIRAVVRIVRQIGGKRITEVLDGARRFAVVMRFPEAHRTDARALARAALKGASSGSVWLVTASGYRTHEAVCPALERALGERRRPRRWVEERADLQEKAVLVEFAR